MRIIIECDTADEHLFAEEIRLKLRGEYRGRGIPVFVDAPVTGEQFLATRKKVAGDS